MLELGGRRGGEEPGRGRSSSNSRASTPPESPCQQGVVSPLPPPFAPMLATLADAPLEDPNLVYEPKYDGIRALVTIAAGGAEVAIASQAGQRQGGAVSRDRRGLRGVGAGRAAPARRRNRRARSRRRAARLRQPPGGSTSSPHGTSRGARPRNLSASSSSICCAWTMQTCAAYRCTRSSAPGSRACSGTLPVTSLICRVGSRVTAPR